MRSYYVIVAAVVAGCSGEVQITPTPDATSSGSAAVGSGGGATAGSGGAASGGGGSGGGSPSGLEVKTATCTTVVNDTLWAEAEFPGRTAVELAPVHAIGLVSPASAIGTTWPPLYTHQQTAPHLVRDGWVAAYCGSIGAGGQFYTSVTFVLPSVTP